MLLRMFLAGPGILIKAILGGVFAVVLMWIAILAFHMWRLMHAQPGLGAVAGGWSYLLQLPTVVLLLSIAFGSGLYLTARLAATSKAAMAAQGPPPPEQAFR